MRKMQYLGVYQEQVQRLGQDRLRVLRVLYGLSEEIHSDRGRPEQTEEGERMTTTADTSCKCNLKNITTGGLIFCPIHGTVNPDDLLLTNRR